MPTKLDFANFSCKDNRQRVAESLIMLNIHVFQLQVTGLSWNATGSVIAASYP